MKVERKEAHVYEYVRGVFFSNVACTIYFVLTSLEVGTQDLKVISDHAPM